MRQKMAKAYNSYAAMAATFDLVLWSFAATFFHAFVSSKFGVTQLSCMETGTSQGLFEQPRVSWGC